MPMITMVDGTRSTTRTGARGSRSCSATAGRSPPTPGRIRCSSWPRGLPLHRPRPPGPRPVEPAVERQRHGHLRRRPGDADETLDLKDAIHVGHSTGGGEVARYIGRHGTKRVAKAVLIGAVPPLMLKTAANPGGLPIEVSTTSAPACSPTARSSSRTSPRPSTAPTGPARRSRRACATRSGCRACWRASRASSTASRRSRRPTSPTTSRSSTSRRWSSTATTTRSCRSAPPRAPQRR